MKYCIIKTKPQYTHYVFGDINDIVGKPLQVVEESVSNCLCMVGKQYIVNVDARDVEKIYTDSQDRIADAVNDFFVAGIDTVIRLLNEAKESTKKP